MIILRWVNLIFLSLMKTRFFKSCIFEIIVDVKKKSLTESITSIDKRKYNFEMYVRNNIIISVIDLERSLKIKEEDRWTLSWITINEMTSNIEKIKENFLFSNKNVFRPYITNILFVRKLMIIGDFLKSTNDWF